MPDDPAPKYTAPALEKGLDILELLSWSETGLSQSELAQELGVESATIVPLINRLVTLGLVERVTTDRDKRKRLLVVTDQGQALFEQVKTVADDLREEILTAITPQEREQTQRVLEKLLREVEKK